MNMNQFDQGGSAMDAAAGKRVGFSAPGGMTRPKTATPPQQFHWRSLGGLRVLSAEFLATTLLVFTINAAVVSIARGGEGPVLLQTAAAIGMAYATLVHTFGHVCGAHMNPAVTVALLSARKINAAQALLYITVQIIGGITGAAMLDAVSGRDRYENVGATMVPTDVTSGEAFGVELILTFMLTMSIFSLLDPENEREAIYYNGGIHVGITYGLMTLAGGSFAGAVFNPARAFGAAVVSGVWTDQWVYWIGPLTGGCLGGLLYVIWFDVGRPAMSLKEAFLFRRKANVVVSA